MKIWFETGWKVVILSGCTRMKRTSFAFTVSDEMFLFLVGANYGLPAMNDQVKVWEVT